MRLFIPTYNRYQTKRANTLRNWPKNLPVDIVVRPDQERMYRDLVVDLELESAGVLTIGEPGIAPTRQAIVEHAGGGRVCMIDDDLEFLTRIPEHPKGYLRGSEPEDVEHMFDRLEATLDEDGFAHAAVSMREGNNRILEDYVDVGRGIRLVAYDADVLLREGLRFRQDLEGREDLDMTLSLLRRGYPNRVFYKWAQGQGDSNAPGGLSETDARTQEALKASAEGLAAAHPGFVKVTEKETKGSWGGGKRADVVCYWKKAYKSSQKGEPSGQHQT